MELYNTYLDTVSCNEHKIEQLQDMINLKLTVLNAAMDTHKDYETYLYSYYLFLLLILKFFKNAIPSSAICTLISYMDAFKLDEAIIASIEAGDDLPTGT